MPALTLDVKLSGPLFAPGAQAAVDAMMFDVIGDIASEGERRVKLQLTPGHGVESGHYSRSIHGAAQSSTHGEIHDSNVIYGPWLEGVSSMNDRTRFKGYAMFRKAFQQLEKLAQGMLQARVNELEQRLGG